MLREFVQPAREPKPALLAALRIARGLFGRDGQPLLLLRVLIFRLLLRRLFLY